MHDIFSREPDPLEGMLRPPSPPENEALRHVVYTRTRRVLRRRRHMRQFAYAASLLMSFAAGVLAMRMTFTDPSDRDRVSAPSDSSTRGADATPLVKTDAAQTQPKSPIPDDSALAMEWTAFDSTEHRAELYRKAGDRYMEDGNDPLSALRSYGNALDNSTEQELTISADDNWLLMAIKDARQKEKKHAKQGS